MFGFLGRRHGSGGLRSGRMNEESAVSPKHSSLDCHLSQSEQGMEGKIFCFLGSGLYVHESTSERGGGNNETTGGDGSLQPNRYSFGQRPLRTITLNGHVRLQLNNPDN